jgi:hypothetical protein
MKLDSFDWFMAGVVLSVVGIFIGAMYPKAEHRELSGKILKDSQGNYYKVDHKIGKTFTLEVISAEDLF